MPGLAIAAASSAAWSEMGAQSERALNTGWIFDQRQDGAGGFISNDSPTSSGLTFQSTGNATAFYPIGRALQVIQVAGTAICTVGQSSFSGGITNVFLNQFSTQAGLSTALSTGAITSVAASPIFPMSTQNNTFGGAVIVSATGGNPSIAVGATPALAGIFRVPNNAGGLQGRNTANSANVPLIDVDGSDVIQIAPSGQAITISGNITAPVFLALGVSPAGAGTLRLPNNAATIVSKTSTGGNDTVWPMQFSSTTLAANVQLSSANTFTNVITKTLAVGTWLISAGVTVGSTQSLTGAQAAARIDDGTNTYVSAFLPNSVWGANPTTGNGGTLQLSAIVSHTTALAYNLSAAVGPTGTTSAFALSIIPGTVSSTGATWWTAVKIG